MELARAPPSWPTTWLIFLGLHVKSRYLVQLLPFLLIAAAWALLRLAELARGDPAARAGRASWPAPRPELY